LPDHETRTNFDHHIHPQFTVWLLEGKRQKIFLAMGFGDSYSSNSCYYRKSFQRTWICFYNLSRISRVIFPWAIFRRTDSSILQEDQHLHRVIMHDDGYIQVLFWSSEVAAKDYFQKDLLCPQAK